MLNRVRQIWYWLACLVLGMAMVANILPAAAQAAGPGQAANTSVQMQAQPAFDGNFKYNEWLVIRVELENNGPDIEAELRVPVQGSGSSAVYAAPVSLPAVSRKVVPLYVLPNNFSHTMEVQLVSGDQLLASQKVNVSPNPNISYMAGILAPERGNLGLLSLVEFSGQQKRPKRLVDVDLGDLPERMEALRSFDLLVLNDMDTTGLTTEQGQALEAWVRQGGRLLVGGGAGAQRTLAGLPEALKPINLNGEASLEDLSGLYAFAGSQPGNISGPFLAATGDSDARVLAEQDGTVLVLEKAVGSGSVDFVALDLLGSPFDAWAGTADLLAKLVTPGASYPDWQPPDISPRQERANQMPYALSNLPVLDLPSTRWLSLLLIVYILLVGPVNYLLLRWRNRLHLAWVTIPALTLLFSAGSFGLGYALRGTDLVVNKIAVIDLQPGGDANVTSYLGLFSPAQQAYEIQVETDGLLSPMVMYNDAWSPVQGGSGTGTLEFVQGRPGFVRGLTVNQWSLQSFMVESRQTGLGQIEGDLVLAGDALSGSIRNSTPYDLKDVVVLIGKRFHRIGDLASGAEAEVSVNLSDLQAMTFGPPLSYRIFEQELNVQSPSGPPRAVELKRVLVESLFERALYSKLSSSFRAQGGGSTKVGGVTVFGWLDAAPPEVSIAGSSPAQQSTAVLYTSLTYSYPSEGNIRLPVGMIPGSLVQLTEGGTCGDPGSTGAYIVRGEAIFEFQVPDLVSPEKVEQLTLSIQSDGGWWASPELGVYDWEQGDWTELSLEAPGNLEIPAPGDHISPSGAVQVRMKMQNAQGCYFAALGLEARQ